MNSNAKLQRDSKRQQEDRIFNRVLIWFACAVAVEAVLLIINRYYPGLGLVQALTVLVPAIAVLALVYYLFQRDFFCISVLSAVGILCLQLYRRSYWLHPLRIRLCFAAAFVLLAAAAALAFLLQRRGGKPLPAGPQLLPRDANYLLLYVTCALNALMLILTLARGGTVPYYLIFVLAGWLFVTAVSYTVKMR